VTWELDRARFTKALYKYALNEGATLADVIEAADMYAESKYEAGREGGLDAAAMAHYEDDQGPWPSA